VTQPRPPERRAAGRATDTAAARRLAPPRPGPTLRRRVDAIGLRVQGRFDSDWSDRVLPWACASAFFVVLTLLASARVRTFDAPADFAGYTQAVWLIHHGLAPTVTATSGLHVLASQVAAVLYPLSGLAYVLPVRAALLLVQSGALALGMVAVWRLCRRVNNLRAGASLCVLAAYALYPATHELALGGFHPGALAVPGLLFAAYFGLASHWRRFLACCLFVMLCQAELGLAVAGLGVLLWVGGRKNEGRVAAVAGLAYALVAAIWIEPRVAGGAFPHAADYAAFGTGPLSVLGGMVTQPGVLLTAVFREANFALVVGLLAPVAFLPLLAPRYLLPVAPVFALHLASASAVTAPAGDRLAAATAFVFLATPFALARIGRMGVERVTVDRRALALLTLASLAFFTLDGVSSPYRSPWAWGGRDLVDQARVEAVKEVQPTEAVRTSSTLLGEFAERPHVWALMLPRSASLVAAADAARGVDVVVLDLSATPDWKAGDEAAFRAALRLHGFHQRFSREGVIVYGRPP
jgi:uncharacterized membrane protein